LDYIRDEAAVLVYQTFTWNCNSLVHLYFYHPLPFNFLYYCSYFI